MTVKFFSDFRFAPSFIRTLTLSGLIACFFPLSCRTSSPNNTVKDSITGSPGEYQGPPGGLPPAENSELLKKYCSGAEAVTAKVVPNYSDTDVLQAALILSSIKTVSFKIYKDILKMHATPMPTNVPGLKKDAHDFLTYLCGEFRDRATMIQSKINWVKAIRYLAAGESNENSCEDRNNPVLADTPVASLPPLKRFDRTKSPWAQMCTEDYPQYLAVSRQVFDFRQKRLRQPGAFEIGDGITVEGGGLKIGNRNNIDRHIPAYTVCETKYIMAEFVKKKRLFRNEAGDPAIAYDQYTAGYQTFKTGCSEEDLGWYYDFRGDSNYKPNSPESNAMIWMSKVFAAQCKTRDTKKPGAAVSDEDCKRYYENPFKSRYLAARAGLGAWLLHDRSLEGVFGNPGEEYYTVTNHSRGNPVDFFSPNGPYYFRYYDEFEGPKLTTEGQTGKYLPGFEERWGAKDFGLSEISGLAGDELKEFIFTRLQKAVDRHTNWYTSSYDSAPSLAIGNRLRRTMDQAYSPFVASSYEMNESNGFSQCGLTIPCSGSNTDFNDHKHWMFIFKVKKENWYRPEDIIGGNVSPDFDRNWFDETSFGDDDLANQERAWDRLGTPLEDELAEILYLWRIRAE